MQTEILERTEQPTLQRVPEPQFHCDVMVEVVKDVFSIRPFRRGRQTQEDPRRVLYNLGVVPSEEMFEQSPIRRRCRMVKLVHDHDIKRGWIELLEIHLRERLNGRKHVPPFVG